MRVWPLCSSAHVHVVIAACVCVCLCLMLKSPSHLIEKRLYCLSLVTIVVDVISVHRGFAETKYLPEYYH